MPRPIDANALIQDFDRRGWDGVQTVVDMMPTLDVAPVVRCKDCASFGLCECTGVGYCRHDDGLVGPKPDDFCSYGERKDGEG